MVIMDLKGITWVGHAYQKFEAMCLEVEDIVYQDAVKYVENQVLTVGASVKKFYLDVMQDVLPPSSMDIMKGELTSSLSVDQTSDAGICKTPKVGIKEEAIRVDNAELTDYSVPVGAVDKDEGHLSSFHGFLQRFHFEDTSFQLDSAETVRGACSDVDSKECNKRSGHNHSSLGAPKISKEENLPSSETSGATTHIENYLSMAILSCELLDENQEASGDQVAVNPILATIEVADSGSLEETYDELENASKDTPGVLTNSSSSKNCNEIENSSANSSCSSLSVDINDVCTNNVVVSLGGSCANEDVQPREFSDKVTFGLPGQSDYSTMDTSETRIAVEQGFEAIQQVDNIEVEETCVLVNGNELHFVPCKEHKHRAYKKKIQDAISSRMRSRRKHEYKELAVWYEEVVKSKQECDEMNSTPSHGSCEFEWELL